MRGRWHWVPLAILANVALANGGCGSGGTEGQDAGHGGTFSVGAAGAAASGGQRAFGGTSSAGTSSVGTPSAGTPSVGTPSAGTPSAGTPSAGTSSVGTPSAGTPSAGTPSAGTPAALGGTSSAGAPVQPMCAYFEAYQENYDADTVSNILERARGCYVLVDPFANEEARDAIGAMKASGNVVGCYISVGTCEDWRDDFAALEPHCVDRPWDDWAGEYFIDEPNPEVMALMNARIDTMAEWGCDMVEFDNMDWAFDDEYRATYGFSATAEEGIAYFQALCEHVHEAGMQCMAKNTGSGTEDFDAGTFESYSEELDWWEHGDLASFLDAGQLGIIVHYDESDCTGVYADYQRAYGAELSFICEDSSLRAYQHFNE